MSDFTDQWANRHDGECESTHIPMDVDEPCHCYRRWLEARLIELEKQDEIHWKTRRTLLKENERLEGRLGEVEKWREKAIGAQRAFEVADEIAVREKRRADDLARRLDVLAQNMAGFNLPPKGAE